MGDGSVTISQLVCYPVKACCGIPLREAVVGGSPSGLLWDRRWMIARAEGGKFLSQRELPRLALVEVAIEPAALLTNANPIAHPDAALVLCAPGMEAELRVPINRPAREESELVPASVWDWSGVAEDEGEAAASWLSTFLGTPARLMRYAGSGGAPARRLADPQYAPPATEVCFVDGYPLLLASEASLADLNARMEKPILMNRFRPNIVVSGAPAWAEDGWEELGKGSLGLRAVKPCDRCRVPRTDQATAEVDPQEPTETLHKFRSGHVLGWTEPKSWKHAVFFGVNLCLGQGSGLGRLAVGDRLEVRTTREGPPGPIAAA